MGTHIYARLSKDRLGDGLGVQRQIEECQALAERLGFGTVPIGSIHTDNDISASTGKRRPGFEELLAAKPDVLVIWAVDRLYRRLEDLIPVLALNIPIHSVTGGIMDLATPGGRLVATISCAVARQEMEQKSARQKSAIAQRVRLGKRNAGQRLYGFDKDGQIVAEEAEWVRKVAAHLLIGGSLYEAARRMNNGGSRTVRGNEWTAVVVRRMIQNPRHAGLNFLHGEYVCPTEAGPIISEAKWRGVVDLLGDPARRSHDHDGIEVRNLLSGVAECAYCPSRITSRKGPQYPRYSCSGGCTCQRQEPIDDYVTQQVMMQLWLTDSYITEMEQGGTVVGGLSVEEQTELAALRIRRESLATDFIDGEVDRGVMLAGIARADKLIAALEAKPDPVVADGWPAMIESHTDFEWWSSLTLEQQRSLIRPWRIQIQKATLAGPNSKPNVTMWLPEENVSQHVRALSLIRAETM